MYHFSAESLETVMKAVCFLEEICIYRIDGSEQFNQIELHFFTDIERYTTGLARYKHIPHVLRT